MTVAMCVADDCKLYYTKWCKRCSAAFCENHIQTHLLTKVCPECKVDQCIEWFRTKGMVNPKSTIYEFRWCYHCNIRYQLMYILKCGLPPKESKKLKEVVVKVVDLFYNIKV